jgi:ACS family hexuronate transporter-like MFS transporter
MKQSSGPALPPDFSEQSGSWDGPDVAFSTRWPWGILSLLLLATAINYLDRIALAVLLPVIRRDLHFTDREYGFITGAFQIAYMAGFLVAGKFIDRVGTRIGFAVSVAWWSVAALLHMISSGVWSLGAWRALLGFGESGSYPAGVKAVAESFPEPDRAHAVGLFNTGVTLAAVVGPPVLVALTSAYGWRASFALTASSGFVWILLWLYSYRVPAARTEPAEIASVTWREALADRRTKGMAIIKFLTDGVWWFYLFWLPPYLYDARHLNLNQIGWALPVVYFIAGLGSVAGGWLAGRWIRQGWEVAAARRMVMGIVAVCMPIAAFAVVTSSVVAAIALISLATAGHQAWSSNLFTMPSDMFPKSLVASVVGINGAAGGLGGFLFSAIVPGYVVTYFGYVPMFVLAGILHPLAWLIGTQLLWGKAPAIGAEPSFPPGRGHL